MTLTWDDLNAARKLDRHEIPDVLIEMADLALKHSLGVEKFVKPGDSYYVLRAVLPLWAMRGEYVESLEKMGATKGIAFVLDHLGLDGLGNEHSKLAAEVERLRAERGTILGLAANIRDDAQDAREVLNRDDGDVPRAEINATLDNAERILDLIEGSDAGQ